MFEIVTPRLRIIPLTLHHFALLLDSPAAMEEALNLNKSNRILEGHELEAMQWLYHRALSFPAEHLWYTNWQIILASANLSIGSACFKGGPNGNGEVEIGYGIDKAYRNNGYMSEAALALCQWALERQGVRSIVAETGMDNPASHRVCEKAGMVRCGKTSSTLLWRLTRI